MPSCFLSSHGGWKSSAPRLVSNLAMSIKVPSGWKVGIRPHATSIWLIRDEQSTVAFDLTAPAARLRNAASHSAQGRRPQVVGVEPSSVPTHSCADIVSAFRRQRWSILMSIPSRNIGYVMGAGDGDPTALRQIGCDVTLP